MHVYVYVYVGYHQRQCPVLGSIHSVLAYIQFPFVCVLCMYGPVQFHFVFVSLFAIACFCFLLLLFYFYSCHFFNLHFCPSRLFILPLLFVVIVAVALCFWQGWNTQSSTLHRSRRTKQKFITFVCLALILLGLLLLFSFIHFFFGSDVCLATTIGSSSTTTTDTTTPSWALEGESVLQINK